MPKTVNYTRHHGWDGQERKAMTLRVPKKLHKQITREALRRKMTINDFMFSMLYVMLNPQE